MDPVIIWGLVALVLLGTERYYNHREAKGLPPTKYDPHYTRKIEKEALGQVYTVCGNLKCKECYHHEIELPKPKLKKCATCKVPLDNDGWCSNGCVKKSLVPYKPKRGELVYDSQWLVYRCGTCGIKFTDHHASEFNYMCAACVGERDWRRDPRYKGYRQEDVDFQRWVREHAKKQKHIEAQREQIKELEVAADTVLRVPPARYKEVDCNCIDIMSDQGVLKTVHCQACKDSGKLLLQTPQYDIVRK